MDREVLEYVNSMEGATLDQRIQMAICSLLYKANTPATFNLEVPFAEEKVEVKKKRSRKKEV